MRQQQQQQQQGAFRLILIKRRPVEDTQRLQRPRLVSIDLYAARKQEDRAHPRTLFPDKAVMSNIFTDYFAR